MNYQNMTCNYSASRHFNASLSFEVTAKNRHADGLMKLGLADDEKEQLLILLCLHEAFSQAL